MVARRADLVRRASALPNLRIMTGTTVTGMFSDNWASAVRGNRFFKIRSKQTVIATGAFDQPLVFRNNDRPGIMFADAAQRLMRLYGVKPGTRAVIATSNRFGYEAALDLLDAGIAVAAVVDLNPTADSPSSEAVRARGVRIIPGSTLVDSQGAPARVVGRRIPHHRRGPDGARPRVDRLRPRLDERRLLALAQSRQPCRRQGRLRPGDQYAPRHRCCPPAYRLSVPRPACGRRRP